MVSIRDLFSVQKKALTRSTVCLLYLFPLHYPPLKKIREDTQFPGKNQ